MGIDHSNPTPLYEQIEKDIKNKIASGKLTVGDQIGSHHQLAKKYEVSLITVKKALSNLVSSGILFSRIGKGTYVANPTNILDLSKHKSIGLVLQDIKHPFYNPIILSLEDSAYNLGYNVLVSVSAGNIEKEEGQIEHYQSIGVSGLIIASLTMEYRATNVIRDLHEKNFPYVMISYMHDPDYWYVGVDHELGGFMATEHLIKTGYKNIGYLHGGKGNLLGEVRKNGYLRALNENDIPFHSANILYLDPSKSRYDSGYEVGKQFFSLPNRPDALFIYTDSAALGFQQAVLEQGFKIPDDVAIVGFNDIEMAQYAKVPLTTISQHSGRIGKLATDILIKRIEGIEVGNRTIIKPDLVVRESCGAK